VLRSLLLASSLTRVVPERLRLGERSGMSPEPDAASPSVPARHEDDEECIGHGDRDAKPPPKGQGAQHEERCRHDESEKGDADEHWPRIFVD
jgi:hypothetical protein